MVRLVLAGARVEGRRLVAVVVAVTLAVGLLVATRVLTGSLAEVSRVANRATTEQVDVLVRADGPTAGVVDVRDLRTVPQELVHAVRAVPGVAAADGQVVGYARLVGRDGELVDPGAAGQHLVRSWPEAPGQDPYRLVDGAAPARADEVVVDANLAGRAGLRVGDRVPLVSTAPVTELTVAGITRFGERAAAPDVAALFTTRETAQRLTGAGDGVHRITLTAAPGTSPEVLAERVRGVAGGAAVLTGAQWRAEQDRVAEADIAQYRALLTLFAGLAVVLGVLVIGNALTVLAAQRARESALLRAVGATGRQVARRLRAEAALAGLVGALLGVPVGLGTAAVLQRLLEGLDLAVRADRLVVDPGTLLLAVAVGVGTAVVGAALPARRSARTAPAAALRDTAVDGGGPVRGRAAAAVAVGAALALAGGRLAGSAPVVALGVLAAGAAAVLAGPLLVRLAGRVLGRVASAVSGAAGELAEVAARRTPRRTSAAALAVAAAVAVTTLVLTVAATLLATFSGTVAAQFRGDLAVLPAGYSSGQAPGLPADVPARVAAVAPGALTVSTVVPPGSDALLDRLGGVSDPRLLERLFDLGAVTGDLGALGPRDVAVHARVADQRGWRPGDTVDVDGLAGPWTVRAVFTGLGDEVPLGGVLLRRDALLAADPSADTTGVYLVGGSRERLAAALADSPLADVVDHAGYVRANEGDFRRILAAVHALLALAGAVSLVGVANTLLLSVTERAPELARLRAIGLTPRQLRAVLRWEALTATLLGVGLGLALGVLTGVALVPALADGLRLTVPVRPLVGIAVGGAVASLALAVPAVRRAARIRPAAGAA